MPGVVEDASAPGFTTMEPVKADPETGLLAYESAQEWRTIAADDPEPTADDCTVLADGTRIDTPEKGRAFLASVAARLAVLNDSGNTSE